MLMTKISFWPLVLGRKDMKKMFLPLVDHDGARLHHIFEGSAGFFGVRLVWPPPSAAIRNTEQYPSRKLINVINLPSGDHAGIWAKLGATSVVSGTGLPFPSAVMV